MAVRSEGVGPERVAWSVLRPQFLQSWEQGEHVSLVGPTGEGKTTVMVDVLTGAWEQGGAVVVVANKAKDPVLEQLQAQGWYRTYDWPPDYEARQSRRVLLWPKYSRASQARRSAPVIEDAFDGILREGRWFVGVDEARYLTEQLGLRQSLDEVWHQGRSSKLTLVASSQGVSWIPKGMSTQVRWLFLFRPQNLEDRKDYAAVAGDKAVADALGTLRPHEFIIISRKDRAFYVSKVGS